MHLVIITNRKPSFLEVAKDEDPGGLRNVTQNTGLFCSPPFFYWTLKVEAIGINDLGKNGEQKPLSFPSIP